jgi:hypothetical protein
MSNLIGLHSVKNQGTGENSIISIILGKTNSPFCFFQ